MFVETQHWSNNISVCISNDAQIVVRRFNVKFILTLIFVDDVSEKQVLVNKASKIEKLKNRLSYNDVITWYFWTKDFFAIRCSLHMFDCQLILFPIRCVISRKMNPTNTINWLNFRDNKIDVCTQIYGLVKPKELIYDVDNGGTENSDWNTMRIILCCANRMLKMVRMLRWRK